MATERIADGSRKVPSVEAEQTEKVEEIQIENAAQQLNVVDFDLLSRESIQFKSRATLRLVRVIVIQGISESSFSLIQDFLTDDDIIRLGGFRHRLRSHVWCYCATAVP